MLPTLESRFCVVFLLQFVHLTSKHGSQSFSMAVQVLAPQAAQPMADIKAATMEPERINPSLRPQEAAEKPSAESRPEAAQPTKVCH